MYEYKRMIEVQIETIHEAFIDAFSEYEVKMDVPIEKLQEMMQTRSYDGRYSIGCFDEGQLVGFSLSGYRIIEDERYCYDTATGIIKAYQNKSVGKEMIAHLVTELRREGIDYFVLEVLENNKPAQKIYADSGFKILRKIKCYRTDQPFGEFEEKAYLFHYGPDKMSTIDEEAYNSYKPSWQNSLQSYFNLQEKHEIISIVENELCLGYIIFHKENGNILQLGIHEKHRDKGYEEVLLAKMQKDYAFERCSFLNVEEDSYMSAKLEALGFENMINQFEMGLKLSIAN